MASPLIFTIDTILNGAGFKGFSAGMGSVLGWAAKGAFALGKFALSGRVLGAVFGVYIVQGMLKFVGSAMKAADAAAAAQVSFNRLRTQMGLLGFESAKNLNKVSTYATKTASTTRFAADTVQEAVTIALRKTGDMDKALKQVSVAQDIAAATGRDLLTVTQLLNMAQSGRTTILRQITNLTNKEIQASLESGKLLDVLATKFRGAASREAQTYAGRMAIAANMTKQLREELGEIALPLKEIGLWFQTAKLSVELFGLRGMKAIHDPIKTATKFLGENELVLSRFIGGLQDGQNFAVAFGGAIAQAGKDTDELNKKLAAIGTTVAPSLAKYEELIRMKIGKTPDEIYAINEAVKEADRVLARVTRDGTKTLTAEEAERFRVFAYFQKGITDTARKEAQNQAETEIDLAKKETELRRRQTRESEKLRLSGGAIGIDRQRVEELRVIGATANSLNGALVLIGKNSAAASNEIAQTLLIADNGLRTTTNLAQTAAQSLKDLGSAINVPQVIGTVADLTRKLAVGVKEKIGVTVTLVTNPVDIMEAVKAALRAEGLTGLMARLTTGKYVGTITAKAEGSA